MPGFRVSGSRSFVIASALIASLSSLPSLSHAQKQPTAQTPTETRDESPFKFKVKSNLVVVRVVVRDEKGKPVEGLRKQDFKLFDQGKEQSIVQFEAETSPLSLSSAVTVRTHGTAAPRPSAPPAMPEKFLALYFDDLYTSVGDMARARDAADRYLAANLQPKDRVAIFTSDKMLSDFTADAQQIRDAVRRLQVSAPALYRELDSPPYLSDNLQQLEQVINYTSLMPGQRTVILVSPGFPSSEYQLDQIVDHALRAQVVISALDAEGLAAMMREYDVEREVIPQGLAFIRMQNEDARREMDARAVMAELAQGTGGEFFRDNNDLKAGFGALAGSPVYYILAYAPSDVKLDGRFHALSVTLNEKQKGIRVQARRGYFAPKNEAEAEAEAKQRDASEAEAQTQEQIREAMFSKTMIRQLPVVLYAQRTKNLGETRDISFSTHLDTKQLRLRKESGRSANTVIFQLAIFDEKQHMVVSQQKKALIHFPDSQLQSFLKTGVDAEMTFNLKPGLYTVREVVTDEEDQMTAFSNEVKVP